MPDYIWDYICRTPMPDGRYEFPEGTVAVVNGFVKWEPNDERA